MKMEEHEIPIYFEHRGRFYNGRFSKVMGVASGTAWFLHIFKDGALGWGWYFQGQLQMTEHYGWQFYEQHPNLVDLQEWFGEYLIAWCDGLG